MLRTVLEAASELTTARYAAIGVLASAPWLFWVGMALVVVGFVAGKVLQMMGFGVKREPAGH